MIHNQLVEQATWDGPQCRPFPFAVGCVAVDQLILAVLVIHGWPSEDRLDKILWQLFSETILRRPQKTAVAESVLITASRFDFCVHSAIVTLDLTGLSWSELTCKLTYLLFKRQRMKQKSWVNFRGMTSWCYSWVLEQKREMIIKHVLLSVCSSRNQASNIVLQPASEIWNYISAVLINKML